MTQLRCEMSKLMQLRDLSVNTQRSYLSAVSGLARHYNMSPDKISKTMVEDYLLYLKNVKKQASNGVGTIVSGLKFFYRYVLSNEENAPTYAQRRTRKLPGCFDPGRSPGDHQRPEKFKTPAHVEDDLFRRLAGKRSHSS